MRARAMAAAGIVLSQPTTQTHASNIWPRQTSSIESAMISRLTSEARIPSVPIVSPSEIATVLNSMGVPPASRIPSFTLAESRRRWKLQGMVSIHVLATPIRGRLRSASVNPTALNMERAPARSRPSVIPRLMCLRSICMTRGKITGVGRKVSKCQPFKDNGPAFAGLKLGNIETCLWTKNGEPARGRFPQCMTLPRDRHACPIKNSALCTGCGARFFDGYSRWRMGRSPGDRLRRTRRHMDHVCDRVPLAEKLADLLLVDIEHQRGLVLVFGGFGVDVMQVQPAARGCVQDAHQCALCVAVTDGESVHVVPKIDCRLENL